MNLYSSNLTAWRRQREKGLLHEMTPKKRGRKEKEWSFTGFWNTSIKGFKGFGDCCSNGRSDLKANRTALGRKVL